MRAQGRLPSEYSKRLRRKFGFWPAWLPDSEVRLGDFGRIRRGHFVREGHLESLSISAEPTSSGAFSDQLFASSGVRHVVLGHSGASAAAEQIRVRIQFKRAFDVFVALRNCGEERLNDQLGTAAALGRLRSDDRWPDDRCLVTCVVSAETALIAVGADGGGALELAGSVPIPDLLTWLGSEVRIAHEASIAYRALISAGCTPLFGLSRLTNRQEFVPRGGSPREPRLVELDPRADLDR